MMLKDKKASRIRSVLDIDVGNRDNWEECFLWLMNKAQDFQSVFVSEIKKIGSLK
jgi:hypothetical protein